MSDNLVTTGARVRLAGQVVSTSSSCEAQQTVGIKRRFVGAPRFRPLVSAHTDSSGSYEIAIKVTRSAEYRAKVTRLPACEAAVSDNVGVFVRVRVNAALSSNPVPQGGFFTISGAVRPNHRGTDVVLQRKQPGGWRKVEEQRLDRDSRYTFTLVVGWEGERTFRVKWSGQDHDHEPNESRALTVRAA